MSLTIYRSSAGSGKTYTLAKEYLKLALRSKDYYQKILAVTFTNRAAEEMKERVLEFLIDIAKGKHELIPVFQKELDKSNEQIIQAAQRALSHLLHHYGYFNITTIDTFFHRVIRSFSREIGLQGSFGIELDTDKVAEFITSNVYEGVEHNEQLRNWLVEFSMEGLGEGEGYETKNQVSRLAKQLFQEEFKKLPQGQFTDDQIKNKVKELKTNLSRQKAAFEQTLIGIADRFDSALENAGLSIDDLTYKYAGPGGFFPKLRKKEYDSLLTKRVEKAREDPSAWTSKSASNKDHIIQSAETSFIPLMNEVLEFIDKNEQAYYTANAVLKHLYTLGLMTDLAQRLQDYKREEEVIMISDLPDFLSQIIDDSGSPFIYEKVGTWYSHFLIDEFQDTSQFQWNNFRPLLEESLANGNENIIVGDAKQSIYGWRGGDPTLLLEKVQEDISQTHIDPSKTTNWRSAKNIVGFNNQLFSALPKVMVDEMGGIISEKERAMILKTYEGVEQEVAPNNKEIDGLVHLEFLEVEDRKEWKSNAIEQTIFHMEQLLTEGHHLNDMAILVRSNKEASEIVSHVLDYRRTHETQIEVISAEGMLLSNSEVVQLLLSAFNHLIHPEDISIQTDLTYRYRKLIKQQSFTSHDDFSKLGQSGLPASFTKYKQHLLHLPILELIEVLVRTFELNSLKSEYVYLQAFQDAVLEFSKNNRSDLRLFMEWWEDNGKKRSVQLTGALDAVEVITSHKSKGLQYPIVFVPFCNFDMNSKSRPVWYESPYQEGENLPVDYKSELEKTRFVENYQKDIAKWHLESLNVLYVAFTRAENALIVFADPPPSRKEKMYSTASKLLWSYFEDNTIEGWNDASKTFRIGTIPIKHRKSKDEMIALANYSSNKWSNKLQVRKTGKAYYDDEVEKSRNEGILLHQILSEIIHYEDTADVLDRYERGMQITKEDRDIYERLINNLWQNEMVKGWFDGKGEVKTEVVVLPKDGEVKRMDRVIINGNSAIVVDFKSGLSKSEDNRQLKEYTALLSEMGYNVEGYLLYLKSGEVIKTS
ncbi:UvrD-helicase domain-containing protein [Ekhidna sp.]|uniref:UvrD-helicase domain-containing protein n=1 Tax=Ekhidna sp. TaxID=2608089 RepID=UPI003CCBA939